MDYFLKCKITRSSFYAKKNCLNFHAESDISGIQRSRQNMSVRAIPKDREQMLEFGSRLLKYKTLLSVLTFPVTALQVKRVSEA